jgi:Tfp pilus assembly protein PilP
MTLAKTTVSSLAMLALLLCTASVGWAQAGPAMKMGPPHKAARPAPKAKMAPKATAGAAADPADPASDDKKIAAEGKRDPFVALVNQNKDQGAGLHLPPGKAGLVIATVRVDGAVNSPNGMIAVVSNPGNSVYFIRVGDRLYDGNVEKIGLDGVTFRENSKDAFGKPVERVVTKRIYASAGEQQ